MAIFTNGFVMSFQALPWKLCDTTHLPPRFSLGCHWSIVYSSKLIRAWQKDEMKPELDDDPQDVAQNEINHAEKKYCVQKLIFALNHCNCGFGLFYFSYLKLLVFPAPQNASSFVGSHWRM